MRQIGKHFQRDDSRHNEKERHDDVQETSAHDADSRMPFVFGGKDALDHVLAGAAIPDANGKKSREHAGERKWFMVRWFEHLEMFRMFFDKTGEIAGVLQREDRNQKSGEQQNDDLN